MQWQRERLDIGISQRWNLASFHFPHDFIDELATPSGLEALSAQAKAVGLRLCDGFEPPPADIALQVWLHDRRLVERVHAELAVRRLRAFRFFRPMTPAVAIHDLDVRFAAMAEDLQACFAQQGANMPGISWVKLAQLTVYQHGRVPRTETYRADDLFESWRTDRLPFDPDVELIAAAFRVQVVGVKRPRLDVLRPPNQAGIRATAIGWIAIDPGGTILRLLPDLELHRPPSAERTDTAGQSYRHLISDVVLRS